MPVEITMPQLSDTMTEGTVVKWHKREGEKVKAGEELADVETDKATMPMEAYESGTLAYVRVKEGEKVKVGESLGMIATAGEDAAEVKKQAAGGGAGAKKKKEPEAREGGAGKSEEARSTREEGGEDVSESVAGTAVMEAEPPREAGEGRLRVSPLARRLAEDKGVDLTQVRGTGPAGRIVERDVNEFMQKGAASRRAEGAAKPAGGETSGKAAPAAQVFVPVVGRGVKKVMAMSKMRSAIAGALQRSKQTVPHFYETIDIDMEEVSRLREKLNARLEKEGVKLSIADFVTRAVASALLRHPALNARFNAEKGEITQYGDVNLGLAVAIPDGLIVPVLRGADQMNLREIRQRTVDLYERARAQRLKKEEQTEATFSITSLGTYGVQQFGAIINPPEVAILAVGSAEPRAVVRAGQVVGRTMMSVTLSGDHRVVDGATGAEFLATLKGLLEEPGMMLV